MNLLSGPRGRKLLFACLYLSEGAPIGFLWLALPTRLRAQGVSLADITWLTAVLVLPWTFKFAWAPLIDTLQTRFWTLRHWIIAAQLMMGLTLLPLLVLDPLEQFRLLAVILVLHAFAAATQDVSIDALCISLTGPLERGAINGWMQTGMLAGRALMGGGALAMTPYIGHQAVVLLLIALTTFSMFLVAISRPVPDKSSAPSARAHDSVAQRMSYVLASVRVAVSERNTWIGLLFAFTGGAAFKALEVIYGPYLIDRQFTQEEIGLFAALPMISLMIAGSLVGGWLSDRLGRRKLVAGSLLYVCAMIVGLAVSDAVVGGQRGTHLLVFLAAVAFGIGLFTAASYALFMDLTRPQVAATQFSAFMGMTNGCESWSSFSAGRMVTAAGYPFAMLTLCAASLLSLPLLLLVRPKDASSALDNPADR